MSYVNLEGLGNRPAWRVTVFALALFVAAVWVGMLNAKPQPPQWQQQTESEPVQVTIQPRCCP